MEECVTENAIPVQTDEEPEEWMYEAYSGRKTDSQKLIRYLVEDD